MKSILKKNHKKRLGSNALLFIFLWIQTGTISAQTTLEQAGGVKTNFIFTQNGDTLNVIDQLLIQRGYSEKSSDHSRDENSSYGYASALGMQVYVIEFITDLNFESIEPRDKKHSNYAVKMLAEDGTVLFSSELYKTYFSAMTTSESNLKIVSFRLKGLPIIMLDKTKSISIDIVE